MKQHLLEYLAKAKSPSVRGLRILIEYFHALDSFAPLQRADRHIVSVFGSARLKPGNKEYDEAKKLGKLLYQDGFAVVTGASQGIMEAANHGVVDGMVADFKKSKKYRTKSIEAIIKSKEFQKKLDQFSLGLKISLPFESDINPHIGLVATFHYFMVRKFFFATLSSAFIACEGGWGTRDELYEMLTLVQTGKMSLMPIIYVTRSPKHMQLDLDYTVKRGYISKDDLSLIDIVSDYKKAAAIVKKFYSKVKKISYYKKKHVDVFLHKPLRREQQKRMRNLVEKKYKNNFPGGIQFHKNKFVLRHYVHKSYGVVRKIIDAM